MIQSLQSLRGIFAIFIFLHHCHIHNRSVMPAGGDCGVTFFIMLSGFVMAAGYYDRVLMPSFALRPFILRRLRRIYPLHLVTFGIWLAFFGLWAELPVKPVVANLTLVQAWIPSPAYYFSCNAVSWCLSALLICYAAFPWIVRMLARLGRVGKLGLLGGVLGIYSLAAALMPASLLAPLLYISPVARIVDFLLGVLLWTVYRELTAGRHPRLSALAGRRASTIQLGTVLLLAAAITVYPSVPLRVGLAAYWWIPSGLLILAFALGDGHDTALGRLLGLRPLVWFGVLSFTFYMVHQLVIRLVEKYAGA